MQKLFYCLTLTLILSYGCQNTSSNKTLSDVVESTEEGAPKLTIESKDGLKMSADFYPNEDAKSIIILCHQAGFSRGEYTEIAPILVDSGFACIAVDLRSGRAVNGVENGTYLEAFKQEKGTKYMDAKQDIEAAIDYVAANSDKYIILWGSSYSASLALMVGKNNSKVKAIVAFSPGEYFSKQEVVKSAVMGLNKPVFITAGKEEYKLTAEPIINVLPKPNVTSYQPTGASDHGAKTLWKSCNGHRDAYKALFDFLEATDEKNSP